MQILTIFFALEVKNRPMYCAFTSLVNYFLAISFQKIWIVRKFFLLLQMTLLAL